MTKFIVVAAVIAAIVLLVLFIFVGHIVDVTN